MDQLHRQLWVQRFEPRFILRAKVVGQMGDLLYLFQIFHTIPVQIGLLKILRVIQA